MHTSFFNLPILLGTIYVSITFAYPTSNHASIPLNQQPLTPPPQCSPSLLLSPSEQGTIHMQSTPPFQQQVPLTFTLVTAPSNCVLLHPSSRHLVNALSKQIISGHPHGVDFPRRSRSKLVYLSSRLTREFPRRTCVVGFDVMLRLITDGEDEEGEESIEKGELGFLLKLFERVVEELGVGVREREGLEIWNVVLEGEMEGLVVRGEFSVSCWR